MANTCPQKRLDQHHFFGRKSGAGFALIEVLVVLALLVVLSAIAAGAFRNMRASEEISAIETRVIALIEEARSRTVSGENNQPHSVYVDTSEAILFPGSTYASSTTPVRTVTFPTNITSSNVTFSNSTITFNRLSGVAGETGSFDITNAIDGETVTITVLESGIIE